MGVFSPVALPKQNQSFVNASGQVTGDQIYTKLLPGWGKTEGDFSSEKLRAVRVPIISDEECKGKLEGPVGLIDDTMLCAGGVEGKGACEVRWYTGKAV